jgi:diacylglycerol O-acyltransferase
MLVLDDLGRVASTSLDLATRAPRLAREALQARSDARLAVRGLADLGWKTMRRPSETPFNQRIGSHRRFDWIETQLSDVQAVRKAFGGSLNDTVLATVAGGVGRFLEHRGLSPQGLEFRVMAPVSVAARTGRAEGLGNKVSAWMVPLPIAERDPRRRLEIVQATTTRLKEEKNALGLLLWARLVSLAPATLLALGAQSPWRGLPFNMVVTNVPGPQQPLYLLGARMLEYHGTLPLTNYLGIACVLVSYAGKLSWGFPADWDLVPDVDVFARCIEGVFRELREAAR